MNRQANRAKERPDMVRNIWAEVEADRAATLSTPETQAALATIRARYEQARARRVTRLAQIIPFPVRERMPQDAA